jgi:hypothetical protein
VPDQEESEQPEPKYVIHEDNDDDYYGYHEGGWVDTDTEEEPMELPEDHPVVSNGSNEDPAGGEMPIQVPQGETRMRMVTMTQMMIQSQPSPQAHHHLNATMRSRYIAWTLLKVHSPRFSGGPCRELASC